ncbi:XdhC family protein [Roseibium sp. CAU 1637]|uniref:XdhC family protein n=1 Tax=Roseibium limicola TaxID=2816037 RepID=A0A939J645_9HYPH|nr:XdhC family protein [Roseibium limicola]MBO0346490.1 XdhC family protein [Roseibium limicola]
MDVGLLQTLNTERAARRAAILVSPLDGRPQRLIKHSDSWQDDPLAEALERRFRSGKSGIVEIADGPDLFLTVQVPPPRLVIIGAVHISKALVPMAQIAGFDVAVIDPRGAFASEARFPADILHADWPEDVLNTAPLDPFTALAAVTHDPKIDDYPLISALKSDCFYVGALGSRKTHGKRAERLQAAGLTTSQINRIDAPIGLDIGAASPEEIAVAVLGQIISALRKPTEIGE